MPWRARCSMCSRGCDTKAGPIWCWYCPTAVARTSPWIGRIAFLRRVRPLMPPWSPPPQTCYDCVSVLAACCAGSQSVRRHRKIRSTRKANMHQPQMELWSAEPHPTPSVYQQLTPQQRSQLVSYLAQLILRMVQEPPTSCPTQPLTNDYER